MTNHLVTYNYFYKKTFRFCEKYLKDYFKNSKETSRPYHYTFNNSSEALYNYSKQINDKFKTYFPSTLSLFNNRANYYSKNDIKLILENEAKQKYLEVSNVNPSPYSSYIHLVAELGQLEALKAIRNILEINSSFIEKMYDLGNFKHFRLVNINSNSVLKKIDKAYSEQLYGKDQLINEFDLTMKPEGAKTDDSKNEDYVNLPELQNSDTVEKQFLNVDQVGVLLGKAKQTIYGLVNRNKIPYYKVSGKLYFVEKEILDWIKNVDEPKISISDKVDEFLGNSRNNKK